MNRLTILCLFGALSCSAALNLPVAWGPADPGVIQWKIYIGTNSGVYQKSVIITNSAATNYTLVSQNLFPGMVNYLTMTELTPIESDFSNEIAVTIPNPPRGFR